MLQWERARGERDTKGEEDGGKRNEKRAPSDVSRTGIRAGDHCWGPSSVARSRELGVEDDHVLL